MKEIDRNDISSLRGNELLEIHLKHGKVLYGYVSSTTTSHSSFSSQSKGVLYYLVVRLDDKLSTKNCGDRIVNGDQINRIYEL